MLPTLVRRLAEASRPSLSARNTSYKLKKVWPPDFSKLSPAEQFRFEKRYKRRVKLASVRPRWDKLIKLTQLFGITCKTEKYRFLFRKLDLTGLAVVAIYSVLFMDWKTDPQPFGAVGFPHYIDA